MTICHPITYGHPLSHAYKDRWQDRTTQYEQPQSREASDHRLGLTYDSSQLFCLKISEWRRVASTEEWSEPSQWLIWPHGSQGRKLSFPSVFHLTVYTLWTVYIAFLGECSSESCDQCFISKYFLIHFWHAWWYPALWGAGHAVGLGEPGHSGCGWLKQRAMVCPPVCHIPGFSELGWDWKLRVSLCYRWL